jgi:hypothetical protein
MANRNQYTAEQFVKAIEDSGGLITTIALKVGCSWNTAAKYITIHPTVQNAYQDECERINDMAQSTIMKAIKEGDAQMAKWWLAKKRKIEFGDALDVTSGGRAIVELRVKYADSPDGNNPQETP